MRGRARPLRPSALTVALLVLAVACSGDDAATSATTSSPSTTTTAPAVVGVDADDGLGDPYYPDLGGAGICCATSESAASAARLRKPRNPASGMTPIKDHTTM